MLFSTFGWERAIRYCSLLSASHFIHTKFGMNQKLQLLEKCKNCTIAQKYFTLKIEENVPDIKF